MSPYESKYWSRLATGLRARLAKLIGATHPEHIVLVPGLLVGLRFIVTNLQLRKLLMTTDEFWNAEAFPDQTCNIVDPLQLVRMADRKRPDIVIASEVTWTGLPFIGHTALRQIAKGSIESRPLLLLDYSHGGAVGFPDVRDSHADIVCGDACKWLLSPAEPANVGFFWFRSRDLFNQIRPAFSSFFLALENNGCTLQSRWLDPIHLARASKVIRDLGDSKGKLTEQHTHNINLARTLAKRLGLPEPTASIIWAPAGKKDALLTKMRNKGLVWDLPRGQRVLCRADILRN
jgi:hypothetical protein